jgi:hypothetical protein
MLNDLKEKDKLIHFAYTLKGYREFVWHCILRESNEMAN